MSNSTPVAVCGKPRLLSADLDGSPLPCATWQADLERQLPYFTRARTYRWRAFLPELREERIQELLVQLAQLFARQYELYGGRVDNRAELVKRAMYWAKVGQSCTRPRGRHADLMDQQNTPKRKPGRHLPALLPSRAEVPTDTRLDIEDWIAGLAPQMREYATLAYHGTPDADIERIMSIGKWRRMELRYKLKKIWHNQQV